MKSQNLGDTSKTNFEYLFEDFPLSNPTLVEMLRNGEYADILSYCVHEVGWYAIHAARMYGMGKYDRDNWLTSKGTEDHDEFLEKNKRSIYRHLAAYYSNERTDDESKCPHLAMVGLRCMIAIEYNG
jgi:hypothetical protein